MIDKELTDLINDMNANGVFQNYNDYCTLFEAANALENKYNDIQAKIEKGTLVDNAPTVDAVPVVRCGECEYRYYNRVLRVYRCPFTDRFLLKKDYCSMGIRKNGNQGKKI